MIKEEEVVMTTLNGLLSEWESLIQGICLRRELTKFRKLWEECVQEEERITLREEKLNENEDQVWAVHTKGKNKRKSYDHPPRKIQGFKKNKRFKKDFSGYECFTCHKMGHISINCPPRAEQLKKNKRFQAHVTEDNDQQDEERTTSHDIPS